jgi:hypothetical protein
VHGRGEGAQVRGTGGDERDGAAALGGARETLNTREKREEKRETGGKVARQLGIALPRER